jgi:hypothetical protein
MKKYLLSSLVIFMLATACTKQETLRPIANATRVSAIATAGTASGTVFTLPRRDGVLQINWIADIDVDLVLLRPDSTRYGDNNYSGNIEHGGSELYYAPGGFTKDAIVCIEWVKSGQYVTSNPYVQFSIGQIHLYSLYPNMDIGTDAVRYTTRDYNVSPQVRRTYIGDIRSGVFYFK